MECQNSVVGDGITHQDNEVTDGKCGGKEREDDGDSQTVLTVHRHRSRAIEKHVPNRSSRSYSPAACSGDRRNEEDE
ncbi:hypothetical protein MRX96_055414 [Rhipicephalus microplus]